jgi:glycosyltransferase involved in cell wall biosynthesis
MLYRSERPDVSFVSTPKAGLLAGLAALITRVPRRVYLLRGLRLETATGVRRRVLWLIEWISLHVAHEVIAVSPSLLALTHEMRLLARGRGRVLGRGASNGVDLSRFAPTPERVDAGRTLRRDLGIPSDAFVFGFVGRLVIDKGLRELAEAFLRMSETETAVWLLVVGPDDGAGLNSTIWQRLKACERVRLTGWLSEPAVALQAIDALVLPTYREGFPNVCIEAAAAGKPVITTTATGAVDAIEDGVTGCLVPPRDASSLHHAMKEIASDVQAAAAMGEQGRRFAAGNFSNEQVWSRIAEFLKAGQPRTR